MLSHLSSQQAETRYGVWYLVVLWVAHDVTKREGTWETVTTVKITVHFFKVHWHRDDSPSACSVPGLVTG
jgi:hypothetical protein